jgi:rubrerythrin
MAVATAEIMHAHYHLGQLGGIGSTAENLAAAFGGEDFEIESMYPAFTAVGEIEKEKGALKGFFYAVEAEKNHRPLYAQARDLVGAGKDLDATPIHVCNVCGHTGTGEAPDECPICGNEKKNFKVF